jgi:hypothetical protein
MRGGSLCQINFYILDKHLESNLVFDDKISMIDENVFLIKRIGRNKCMKRKPLHYRCNQLAD